MQVYASETASLFCKEVVPFYFNYGSVRKFQVLHIFTNSWCGWYFHSSKFRETKYSQWSRGVGERALELPSQKPQVTVSRRVRYLLNLRIPNMVYQGNTSCCNKYSKTF